VHMKLKYILIVIFCLTLGVASGFGTQWYASGLFPDRFRALPQEERMRLLRKIGQEISPFRVRELLLFLYPTQPPEQHELAHLIGEAAYKKEDTKGFRYCDSVFTFACFHGVILAAIKAHGYNQNVLAHLSLGCNEVGKNETAKVSCAHGMGHGIMWVKNYDLIASFQTCDEIFTDQKLRFFCWDGVSMENVVRRSDTAKGLPVYPWKPDNIYFPCDSVPQAYEPACVREHVFLLRLAQFNRDTQKTIDYCLHFVSEETRKECFGGLGGALQQDDPSNISYTAHECLKGPLQYSISCIGRAATQYAYAGQKVMGESLCKQLPSDFQESCIMAIDVADSSRYIIKEL
jgi:hypothetical protein